MSAPALKRPVVAPSEAPRVAATFNLADPSERRVFDIIQRFYGPDEADRLHAIRRETRQAGEGLRRVVVTLGSFQPQRKGASVEWMVIVWDIDAIEIRMHPCKSRQAARRLFDTV